MRIALNLFGHYIHLIKQRKIKPYATNLLPCILSIAKRREQQLIETLSEFVVNFCENLQICLNESEVLKLMEVRSTVLHSIRKKKNHKISFVDRHLLATPSQLNVQ